MDVFVGPDGWEGLRVRSGHFDHFGTADQDGDVVGFLHHGMGGAQHALILAFGKDDAAVGQPLIASNTGRMMRADLKTEPFRFSR